jgi:flagellar biosynthesis chaperone FliJ
MKKFRFPLARVLELRQRELEAAQSRVAALRRRRDSLEAEAARLESERREVGMQTVAKLILTGRELAAVNGYVGELDRRRRLSIAAARQIQAQEIAAVQAAVEARRKVRLLEIVESKRRRTHRAAFDREQEALVAELFLAGIPRRQNPGGHLPGGPHPRIGTAIATERVLPQSPLLRAAPSQKTL